MLRSLTPRHVFWLKLVQTCAVRHWHDGECQAAAPRMHHDPGSRPLPESAHLAPVSLAIAGKIRIRSRSADPGRELNGRSQQNHTQVCCDRASWSVVPCSRLLSNIESFP